MFQSYRVLFQSLFFSSFIHGLTGTPDNDGNRTNIDELIGIIAGDKRLDGKDNLYINELLDKLASSTEISDTTRQQISIQIKGELEKSLLQWYTVLDENSYKTYVRVMNFLHPQIQFPSYWDIKGTFMNTGIAEFKYTFIYNPQDKSISIHIYDLSDEKWWGFGSEIGKIQNGKFVWGNDFLNWDAFSNNNQFGLSADIIDATIPKPEPKEEEPKEEEPLEDTLPPEAKKEEWEKPKLKDIPPVQEEPKSEPEIKPELELLPPPVFPEPDVLVVPEVDSEPEEPKKEEKKFVPPRWPHTPTPKPKPEPEPEPEELIISSPRPKPRPTPAPDKYTVQSGDRLWDIVKDHYGLTDNQAIAKRVNQVVESQIDADLLAQLRKDVYGGNKRNVKDGIKGDILNPGDIILLPVFDSAPAPQDDGDK